MIVEPGHTYAAILMEHRLWAQVDRIVEELLNQESQRVSLDERRNLVAELEFFQNLLNVRREAVQIRLEVGLELLPASA
jgi:hypothetical protein